MEAWIIFPKIQFPAHIKRHTRSQSSEQEREWFQTLCARFTVRNSSCPKSTSGPGECVSKERGSKEINFSLSAFGKKRIVRTLCPLFPWLLEGGRCRTGFKFSAVPLAVHLTRSGAINHSGRMLNVHNDVLTIITFERPNNNTLDSK